MPVEPEAFSPIVSSPIPPRRRGAWALAPVAAFVGACQAVMPPCAGPTATVPSPALPTTAPGAESALVAEIEALVERHDLLHAQRLVLRLPLDVIAAQIAKTEGTLQLVYADVLVHVAPERREDLMPVLLRGAQGYRIVTSLCAYDPDGDTLMTWGDYHVPDEAFLTRILTDSSSDETRCEVLRCMAQRNVGVPAVREAVEVDATRSCALRALGGVGDPADLTVMRGYLHDPDREVVRGAVDGLSSMPLEEARDALLALGVEAARAGDTELESAARKAWLGNPLEHLRPGLAARVLPPLVDRVMDALSKPDFGKLAALVHPTLGLRFGYYGSVAEPRFTPREVQAFARGGTFLFGYHDGSGSPNYDTPAGFIATSLAAAEFRRPDRIGFDTWVQGDALRQPGSTAGELAWTFPDALFAELVLDAGSPQNPGLWRTLTLFFSPFQGDFRLVGLVHDGWTI